MTLGNQIVAWARQRPRWQQEIMRRIADGDFLSDADYDRLVDSIVDPLPDDRFKFDLEHFQPAPYQSTPVCIKSIEKTAHVNALASHGPLSFKPTGLTVVYGDNGSGKSGYARLLKQITKARHQEDVLSNVFKDTVGEKPTASLVISIGDQDKSVNWPEQEIDDLQRMHYYDKACMDQYVSKETDFPYRPSQLEIMYGLIDACVIMRHSINKRLADNTQSAEQLPVVSENLKDSPTGKCLAQLSDKSSIESIDRLIARLDNFPETYDKLKIEENHLRSADSGQEQWLLTRQAEKLLALHDHVESVHSVLGNDNLAILQESRRRFDELQDATTQLAQAFASEPLPGVGSSPWRTLWESARRFSEEYAYPNLSFPVVGDKSQCVLCHQTLSSDGRTRLLRFEEFVKNDTQMKFDEAQRGYLSQIDSVTNIEVFPEVVKDHIQDLVASRNEVASKCEALLEKYQQTKDSVLLMLEGSGHIELPEVILPATVLTQISNTIEQTHKLAKDLADPKFISQKLAHVTAVLQEYELLQELRSNREIVVKEIMRLKARTALETAKAETDTGAITRKINEFAQSAVTKAVRDQFTQETDRLRLGQVTINRTRSERGMFLHKPELDKVRQEVQLKRVFSEGELSSLGLAAFFTEAELDSSKSALILDDPVTSLDHIRRNLVATRLASFAKSRQVILFTHDVAFVADLKLEATVLDIMVAERSVLRSRSIEHLPGTCIEKHPWKALDVNERLDELRRELAHIKKHETGWDQEEYEKHVGHWAGKLSETWERIFNIEIVGQILAEGGLEVRPKMVRILALFSDQDCTEFSTSYKRVSIWARRHDKSPLTNYVVPDPRDLEAQLQLVASWVRRIRKYRG